MLRLLDGAARLGGCSLGSGAVMVRFVALTGRSLYVALRLRVRAVLVDVSPA